MKRSTAGIIVILALTILAASLTADAQQRGKIPRVGVLVPGYSADASDPTHPLATFRQSLRDLGYVEGQTILLEYRFAAWQNDRLPGLATELVQLHPEVTSSPTPRWACWRLSRRP